MPKKCTHTHAGLQHIAAHAAHAGQRAVHGMDDSRRGIKRCQRGFLRGGVFLRRQQFFQLRVLAVPVVFIRVKGIGKTAPAEIPGQNILLGLCGRCAALLDLLECPNCVQIGNKLGLCPCGNLRLIGCKVVGGGLRGGLVGRKGVFLRLVFFHLVEVYFHEAVKIKIGENRLVQIIERAIPFLRVESIVHQLGDSAVLQISIHLNDVLLILSGGIAQIDSCQVGKVRLGDFKFVLEIILNVG